MKTKEDLLTDPEFVAWVKEPNEQLDAYWSRWMAANPEQVGELKGAREFLLRVRFSERKAPLGVREEILQQLLHEKHEVPQNETNTSRKTPFFTWIRIGQFYRIAAILLLSFGLSWWISPAPKPAATALPATETIWIEKITLPGEKLQLTLGDGSRIWMNANSSLSFPEHFDSLQRSVRLVGEAYFEVEKDSLRPFHVETNGLVTTVLGTTFNIDNMEGISITISLVSGAVKITDKTSDELVLLEPGQALDHDAVSGKQEQRRFDPNVVLAWKDGWIRFDRASLEEVLKTLENWYGVEVRLQGTKPLVWQFSGEYKEQTLEEVLSSMAYIKDFEYSIYEKIVQLKF